MEIDMDLRAFPAPMDAVPGPIGRRLQAATGLEPDEARAQLREAARDATDAPAYPLMQTLCQTLAEPNRLLITTLLKRHPELSATELQVALGTAQATVSHHLRVLQDAGLVRPTADGKWTRYRLDPRYDRLIP